MFVYEEEEEAAIDGDPVVECCRRDTFICCLLLCLFKNALKPTAESPFTSVTEVTEEREARALTSWVSIFARAMEIDVCVLHCLSLCFHICLAVILTEEMIQELTVS